MGYTRTIPRDLFNESKLLKCLGQLSLKIHEGIGIRWNLTIEHDDTESEGFDVRQDPDTGHLYCLNIMVCINGIPIDLSSRYNAKAAYPLVYNDEREGDDVFDDEGNFSPEFIDWLDRQSDATFTD